jgi:hypothetical protein
LLKPALKHCKTLRIMRRLFRPGGNFGWNFQDLAMPQVAESSARAVAFLLSEEGQAGGARRDASITGVGHVVHARRSCGPLSFRQQS